MSFAEVQAPFDLEPTLRDELSVFGEDGGYEFMNLLEDATGVPGVIEVTTFMGAHGPRVKFYLGRPGLDQPSFSVSV